MIKIIQKLILTALILSTAKFEETKDTLPKSDMTFNDFNTQNIPNKKPEADLQNLNNIKKTETNTEQKQSLVEEKKSQENSEDKARVANQKPNTSVEEKESIESEAQVKPIDNVTPIESINTNNKDNKKQANLTEAIQNPENLPGDNTGDDILRKKVNEIKNLSAEMKNLVNKSNIKPTQNEGTESKPSIKPQKRNDKITLDEKFEVIKSPSIFRASRTRSNQIYKLNISGFNVITIEISDRAGNKVASHEIALSGQENGCIVPIAPGLLQPDYQLKLYTTQENILTCEATLSIVDYLEMDFNSNDYVITHFIHELHYKVKNPKKYLKQNKENRVQFIMQTSLDNQKLTGNERVEMFINKKANFPTEDSYELKASGSLGYGLIRSLSSDNPYYCVSDNCDYYVTIYVYNVEHIYFFPTIFANDSEINFNTYLFLIEEVEPRELVTYKLVVPKTQSDWLFSVIPTEGTPDFYINPDFKPNSLKEYKYKATGQGPENLLITYKESQDFGFTHEVFYVTYKSQRTEQSVTFKFEVNRMEENKKIYLKENYLASGVVAKDEIINYYLNLQNETPNSYSVNIDLMSLSGNADLYLKECLISDKDCAITETDIKNARGNNLPARYAGRVFRYSAMDSDDAGKKIDKILLNVNCFGRNGPTRNFKPNPRYRNSRKCMFAVGVHCRDSNNKYGTLYRLVTYGNKSIDNLQIYEATSIKVLENENKHYEVDLNYFLTSKFSFAVFRVYALTGACNIYFSRTTDTPSSNDFENMLKVKTNDMNVLSTNVLTTFMDISQPTAKNSIFLTVEGLEYCIFDIYIDMVRDINEAASDNERLKTNKMIQRSINEQIFTTIDGRKVFYNSFYLEIPFDLHHSKDLDVSLDSDMMGFEICVQLGIISFDSRRKCDYESFSETLTISNTNNKLTTGKVMAITVLKYDDKDPKPVFFPIDFRLMVTIDNAEKNGAELLSVGKSHSKKLNPGDNISYVLNLTKMTHSGLIILTSESPSVNAVLTKSLNDTKQITQLNYSQFALRINNVRQFKLSHCDSAHCEIYVKVYNTGLTKARFTLTYTVDNIPITIREGNHLYVPSDKAQYFITKPNIFNPLSFNIAADKTASVIFAQVFTEEELKKYEFNRLFSENKFDFKSHIDTEAQIVIPPSVIEKRKATTVGYLVVPKFDVSTYTKDIVVYDQTDKMSVNLHSNITKLDTSVQLSSHINKGDFKYYYIHVDEPKDFNIVLNINSGEADLYLNPGMYNLTTTQYYWEKRTSYKDDELLITKDMFSDPYDMVGTYTIGVYAREYSQFSIRYTQDEFNIIKLHYQRMVDTKLEKGKNYYFDFYNKHSKFNSILYAEDSDVEVSVLNYDEKKGQNFLDMIDNDKNYLQSFVFKKGDVPRKKISMSVLEEQSHYIVRMKALEKDAKVTFSIYDKTKPLIAYMEKRFMFAQDAEDEQVFMIKLDSNYREVDLDFKLDFGNVEFSVGDDKFLNNDTYTLDKPKQLYVKYTVGNIKKSNDIIVFKTILIRVKAKSYSKYSIFVKPVDKFKQLKALENELVYVDKNSSQYLYYVLNKKDLHKVNSLIIDIYTVNYYGDKPELLFMSDDDVTLNAESPFMPMPMIDFFENFSGRFIHYEIKPEILPGFYVIKLPTSKVRLPVKISVSINDEKIIEPNSVFSGRIDSSATSVNKYTAYIPEAGEFRFLMESCSNLKIDKALFTHSSNSTEIEFETRFAQSLPFLSVDKSSGSTTSKFKVSTHNIRRGIVGGPGLVKFNVTAARGLTRDKDVEYFIISEFRPAHKELFMYDYVDLFFTKTDNNAHKITYSFKEDTKPLTIKAPMPHFRDQLFADYPDIQKIKIEFTYYLFVADDFEGDLNRCGIAAVKPFSKVKHNKYIILSKDDINKHKTFEFYFYKSELKDFENEPQLTFFTSMGITYIESEEDEHHVSLNHKYASVPYFVLVFSNEKIKTSNFKPFIVILSGLVLLLLLFTYCAKKFHTPSIGSKNRSGYEKSTVGGNKLEMTTVNNTTIED